MGNGFSFGQRTQKNAIFYGFIADLEILPIPVVSRGMAAASRFNIDALSVLGVGVADKHMQWRG